ncbi:unnamed protein product [Musa textilis]
MDLNIPILALIGLCWALTRLIHALVVASPRQSGVALPNAGGGTIQVMVVSTEQCQICATITVMAVVSPIYYPSPTFLQIFGVYKCPFQTWLVEISLSYSNVEKFS